jgi:hypothetical protein
MVFHPVETGKAVGEMALGAVQTLARTPITTPTGKVITKYMKKDPDEGLRKLQPLIDDLKFRYGSTENFKRFLSENPVEVLADISSVLVPLTKGTSLARAGQLSEPINLALKLASKPFKLLPERIPMRLYQKAVKFGTTLSMDDRNAVTRTALKAANQIMPTEKGLIRLRGMINSYNDEINKLINVSAKRGEKISVNSLYKNLKQIKNKFKEASDEPLKWDAAFNQMKKQWKEALELDSVRTPEQIQKIKQRIYRDLETFYEQHKASPAKVELRKAIARNAREQLENIIPEIKQLNKNEGALIELWGALESKANRITNKSMIGFDTYIKSAAAGGVGYMLTGSETGAKIGTGIGLALSLYEIPEIKAKIGLVLNRLKEQGVVIKPRTSALALGLYQMEKILEEKR